MPAGLAGHLLSASFLESRLQTAGVVDSRVWRRFVEARRRGDGLGPSSSLRAILEAGAMPLLVALGFEPPRDVERLDPVLISTVRAGAENVALILAPWGEPLDLLSRTGIRQAICRAARWCALFNGTHLRLVDATRPYSRRFVQFDLDLAADDEETFAAFWYVMQALPAALDSLVEESERHGAGVCRSLKHGVLSASADVLAALVHPISHRQAPTAAESFEQALTIVYRMLFLLFAEARALVPLWHPVYRESYSIEALARRGRTAGASRGLWDALRAIARLAHAGCRAGDLRVTPFNGRLFAPARTPLAERRDLDDEAARRAIVALSTTRPAPSGGGRERIAYRDLGVEQLGAVYETLLDYEPQIEPFALRQWSRAAGCAVRVSLERGSGVRKATGTFYTPQPIADYLVRRTLGPLVRDAAPRADSPAAHRRSGDGQRGVSGRRVPLSRPGLRDLAGAIRRLPSERHRRARTRGDPADDRRTLPVRRRPQSDGRAAGAAVAVAGHAGGRLAAQLSRSSSADRRQPARHVAGDADAPADSGAHAAARHGNLAAVRHGRRANRTEDRAAGAVLARGHSERHARAGASEGARAGPAEQTRDRPVAMEARRRSLVRRLVRRAACVYPSRRSARCPTRSLPARAPCRAGQAGRYLDAADAIARARRLFHWELEFPEVFFDADGGRLANAGFDAVIGNPPWDMIRADAGTADSRVAFANRHRAGAPLHARCRHLHGAIERPREPVSAVRRARDRARPPRRPIGAGAAVRPGDRSGQRAAAPAAAVRVRRRRARRDRQPARRVPDPSQRAISAVDGDDRVADEHHRLPARRATIPRRSSPRATNRRRRRRGSRSGSRRELHTPRVGRRLGDSRSAERHRPGDCRTRGGAVSAARRRGPAGRASAAS